MSNEPAVVRLTAPGDLIPFQIVGPPEDTGVIGEIVRSGGTYQPQIMRALRSLMPEDGVAFDIGANIGVFVVAMSRLAPRGRIYAFEPAPESYDYLVRNVDANQAANAVTERLAVYDRTGDVPFVFSTDAPTGSFVDPGSDGAAIQVGAVRLDDYVDRQGLTRVDLVMIDAEGAELAVLRGAERTLSGHRPALLVELNPVAQRRFGGASWRELAARLRRWGALHALDHGGQATRILSDRHLEMLLRQEGVVDLLCLPWGHRLRTAASWVRGARQERELATAWTAGAPPENNFVVEPSFALGGAPSAVSGHPRQACLVTLTVRNTSPYWYSSDFVYHPVHVSYRWLNGSGAQMDGVVSHRGRFAAPLGPGASATVECPVTLPAVPGDYQLAFTMLQESFAWFDDLDPTLRTLVPGTVVG